MCGRYANGSGRRGKHRSPRTRQPPSATFPTAPPYRYRSQDPLALRAFQARPDRMEFLSIRTHAKLLLLAFEDGRKKTEA